MRILSSEKDVKSTEASWEEAKWAPLMLRAEEWHAKNKL
jgi:hypothetical protein